MKNNINYVIVNGEKLRVLNETDSSSVIIGNISSITVSSEEVSVEVLKKDYLEEPLFKEILEYLIEKGYITASLLQREFKIGYNRAIRAINSFLDKGLVKEEDNKFVSLINEKKDSE